MHIKFIYTVAQSKQFRKVYIIQFFVLYGSIY